MGPSEIERKKCPDSVKTLLQEVERIGELQSAKRVCDELNLRREKLREWLDAFAIHEHSEDPVLREIGKLASRTLEDLPVFATTPIREHVLQDLHRDLQLTRVMYLLPEYHNRISEFLDPE